MNETLVKGIVIGVVVGVIGTVGITLGTGVFVARSEATSMTDTAVQDALIDTYASICVENFTNSPNFEDALRRLGDTPYHARQEFIQNGGFARVPGQERPHPLTSDSCARRLTEIHELSRG